MEPIREITEQEYDRLYEEYEDLAERLEDLYNDLGWIGATSALFFSDTSYPCVYAPHRDPKTGDRCIPQELPKTFRSLPRSDNTGVYHFNPTGCPNLTPNHVVKCLAYDGGDNKFYHGEHFVGQCPHKKREGTFVQDAT